MGSLSNINKPLCLKHSNAPAESKLGKLIKAQLRSKWMWSPMAWYHSTRTLISLSASKESNPYSADQLEEVDTWVIRGRLSDQHFVNNTRIVLSLNCQIFSTSISNRVAIEIYILYSYSFNAACIVNIFIHFHDWRTRNNSLTKSSDYMIADWAISYPSGSSTWFTTISYKTSIWCTISVIANLFT